MARLGEDLQRYPQQSTLDSELPALESPRCHSLIEKLAVRGRTQREDRAITFLGNGETESGVLTYGKLSDQALALGAALRRQGAAGGRVLLLYLTCSP